MRKGIAPDCFVMRDRWGSIICLFLMTWFLCAGAGVTGAFPLTVTLGGSGSGNVTSMPLGLSCPGVCSGSFEQVLLSAAPAADSLLRGWGGECAGMEYCSIVLTGEGTVAAFFDRKAASLNVSGPHYRQLQVAYNGVQPGGRLQVAEGDQRGDLRLDKGIEVTLQGGYLPDFTSASGMMTRLLGKLTVVNGSLRASRLRVSRLDFEAPRPPTGIVAVAGDRQLRVTWNPVNRAGSYNIYYATSPGVTRSNGTKVPYASSGQILSGLSNGTVYYLVVTAVGAAGDSMESAQVMIAPAAPPAPLAVPTGVTASPGDGTVQLSWSSVAGATSYNIYWSTDPGVTRSSGTRITVAVPSYRHPTLANGTTYYYTVTANRGAEESAASAVVSARPAAPPLTPPAGVRATAGSGKVDLDWEAVPGATSYTIHWSTTPGVTPGSGTKISGIAAPPYQQSGLSNGTSYYYIVTANRGTEESPPAAEVSACPAAPGTGLRLLKSSLYQGELLHQYTLFDYDAAGRKVKESFFDFADNLTRYNSYQYNEDGRIIKFSSYEAELGGLVSYTTTEYNAAGNPVTVSTFMALSGAPIRTGYIVHQYDDAQNVIRTTSFNGYTNMINNYTLFEYNAAGDVTRSTDCNAAGMVTGYQTTEYDGEGREIKASSYTHVGLEEYVTTEYDPAGMMSKVTTYNGVTGMVTEYTSYQYNAQNRLSRGSSYDCAGNLKGYVTTSYNEQGKATDVSTFDDSGLMARITFDYGN